jgi:hypothetical protein
MSETFPPHPQPPTNDPPIAAAGNQHSEAWTGYFQHVADALGNNTTALTSLTTRVDALQHGVTDGSNAAAGDVGEYLSNTSGAVSLTSAATANVVSLALPAGDWDVAGSVVFSPSAGTNSFFGAGMGGLDVYLAATFSAGALNQALNTSTRRYNVTAATTVWVVARAVFTGTGTATGAVRARRMR